MLSSLCLCLGRTLALLPGPAARPRGPVRLCSGELAQVWPALMAALGEAAGHEGPRTPWRHGAGGAPGSACARSLVLEPRSFPGCGLHLALALAQAPPLCWPFPSAWNARTPELEMANLSTTFNLVLKYLPLYEAYPDSIYQ